MLAPPASLGPNAPANHTDVVRPNLPDGSTHPARSLLTVPAAPDHPRPPFRRQNGVVGEIGGPTSSVAPGRPTLRVGCAMWANTVWRGRFLRGEAGHELADYATWCNAVEGNTTFYAVPPAATVAKWAEQAPPDFRFAFKAPRTVTHERRLHPDAHRDLAAFLRAIEPLGERIGPVQLQLPPSFGPESTGRLAAFVSKLPLTYVWAVELRHRGFFDGGPAHRAVDDMLGSAEVGRVVLDPRALYAAPPDSDEAVEERRTKPSLPIATEVVGGHPIVRVIGADDADVSADGLAAWVPAVAQWLGEGRRPYVFAHQPRNLESPALARRFHAAVAGRMAIADLPTPCLPTPRPPALAPDQSSLF